ncbi:unnamed protein product [Polarella glacialis]|uniref:Uncharacterized protein n=1 Tax=Polarella glacialis TaxID=89957 RepID=A0A813JED6_POLGL|nr:unnamed protein product [Polarella glacialis]
MAPDRASRAPGFARRHLASLCGVLISVAIAASFPEDAWSFAYGAQALRSTLVTSPRLSTYVARGRRSAGVTSLEARVDGEFGVLPETAAPLVELIEKDPILEQLIATVQAADKKRGVDISAFWIKDGFEVVVLVTALSRPQLQAIANEVDYTMRKQLHLKRMKTAFMRGQTIRTEASSGWACLVYNRITVHVQTPTQRTYYDIEGLWRDENQDYEKIPLEEVLRENGFGNMRLTKELSPSDPYDITPQGDDDDVEGDQSYSRGESLYEEDQDDPFWS